MRRERILPFSEMTCAAPPRPCSRPARPWRGSAGRACAARCPGLPSCRDGGRACRDRVPWPSAAPHAAARRVLEGASIDRFQWTSLCWLERDVVIAGADRRRTKVPFVDRRLAARRSPVSERTVLELAARGGVLAGAQELHGVGNDIRCLPFAAVLRLPLAPLQTSVDRHGAPLGQVARDVL